MALVRFGGGVAEIRGSINGNTFSRSRAGAIVRNRTTPIQPNTIPQSDVRQKFQEAADGFRSLTVDQVNEWAGVAQSLTRLNSFGETYVPSGKQLFMEVTLNSLLIGGGPIALEKVVLNPNLPSLELGSAVFEISEPDLAVATLSASSNFGTQMIVQATRPLQTSVRNFKKFLRQIGVSFAITSVPAAEDLLTAYNATYPGVLYDDAMLGMRVGFRARSVNPESGLSSAWVYAESEITVTP